jgi:multiple sugar transport system ATP-binding protein
MNLVTGEPAKQQGAATIGVRPEHIKIERDGAGGWQGTIAVAEHLGSDTFLYVDAGPLGMLTARYIGELSLHAGDRVSLVPDPTRIHRFDESGKAIRG